MNRIDLLTLANDIVDGSTPTLEQYQTLADIPDHDAFSLCAGADMIREFYFGREVHLCVICNGKSGRCSENCSFCSQSAFAKTDAPIYPLMNKNKLQEAGRYAADTPVNRYSIVTSGKRLPKSEVVSVAEALSELQPEKIATCASLGILSSDDFKVLTKAGITRYHHNLETAESNFQKMCTTHSYEERVDTIKRAQEAGLSICSGGVFGIGETDRQVLELALALKELKVDCIPLNFLVPIKGTQLENSHELTPLRCLKIIAIFRYVLPDKDILICGGREANLGDLHSLIFYSGASGIMTGDYLTTSGLTLQKDLDMIDTIGFTTREKELKNATA